MAVTVVIATHDRRQRLLATLGRLVSLPERPPLVVVDNGSSDGSAGAVERAFPGVEVVRLDGNAGAAARTAGVERASTALVAFADDDSWWAPGSLPAAEAVFARHPRLGLAAARILVGEEEVEDPTCARMAASPLPSDGLPGPRVLGFVACGAVVRRSAYLEAGGFDPRLAFAGEERLLALELARRGWVAAYVPELVAFHHPSALRDVGRRRRLEVRNALWTAWLTRPLADALRETAGVVGGGLRKRDARGGLVEAVRGIPWVLRSRRPLQAELLRDVRAVERAG